MMYVYDYAISGSQNILTVYTSRPKQLHACYNKQYTMLLYKVDSPAKWLVILAAVFHAFYLALLLKLY